MRPIAQRHAHCDRCWILLRIRAEGRNTPNSCRCTATVVIHERERSTIPSGPPGSRSQRLRIKPGSTVKVLV